MNMVPIGIDFVNTDSEGFSASKKRSLYKQRPLTSQYSLSKLGDEYHMECEEKDTMVLSLKVYVPTHLWPLLEEYKRASRGALKRMLANRKETSTKYYKELPSVVAKALVRKYQRNKKCKKVRRIVIPVCGDKGRQVKLEGKGIRIPSLFKKEILPVTFRRNVVNHLLQVEFFKKNKEWYGSIQYRTPKKTQRVFHGVIGVDRNAKENVAVAAHSVSRKVKMLGPCSYSMKKSYRHKRDKLQKKNKKKALVKLSAKQLRCSRDINHKVSRNIVSFAEETSSAIVLEDLGTINKGKATRFAKRSQWAFHQLALFIQYKAALSGIPVFYINPYNTSKECSRCGATNTPSKKAYKCSKCEYIGHRDVNASFNIINRWTNHTLGATLPAYEEPKAPSAYHVGMVGLSGDPPRVVRSTTPELVESENRNL